MIATTPPRGLMDTAEFAAAVATFGPTEVVARLAPYLTPARQARIDAVLGARVASLQVALEAPQDPHNAAAVVRTAEALGAGTVHVVAAPPRTLESRRITRGAFYWADTREHADWPSFMASVPLGMRIVGACVGTATMTLAEVPVDAPLCVVFGSEKTGLSPAAVAACEHHFAIPMVGMVESLNVSVAAGIALYELLARRRLAIAQAGDMDAQELAVMRARWYAKAVDPRLACVALGWRMS